MRTKWEQELVENKRWEAVRECREVKICAGPNSDEVFLLCRSKDRRRKEAAMHERFNKRIVEGLERSGTASDPGS
ncbi:MAG: hypothetical protein ACE5F1_10340 [Planctomycetota bacterium]